MINNAVLHLLLRELTVNGENEHRLGWCVCECGCAFAGDVVAFVHMLGRLLHMHTPPCANTCAIAPRPLECHRRATDRVVPARRR